MSIITPLQVVSDPQIFAEKFLKIIDKQDRLIPFRWNSVQKKLHNEKTGRDLVLKARQMGITTFEQGDIFRDLVTKTTRAITLSHDDTTTQIIRQTADRFYEHCAFNDIKPSRRYANATMATYMDYDSMHVIGTAGNTEVGRGGSYSRFHGSEVAKWKDAEKIMAGAMQGGNPQILLESTPNGAQGFFYQKAMEALDGNSIWKLHFFPWWDYDNYRIPNVSVAKDNLSDEEKLLIAKHKINYDQIEWRRFKMRELGRLFSQEYPEDPVSCFLTSGNSYFGDLTGVFTAPLNTEYQQGHEYTAGLDFGQTHDYTAMPVFDKTVKCQVDLLHIRDLPWAEQRQRIKGMYDKWHLDGLLAEKNSIGEPNIEALHEIGVAARPFDTTNESKAGIMSNMNEAIHFGGWKLLDIPEQKHELNTFVATQLPSGVWRLAAGGDGHDDIVMGDALGIWQATNQDWLML